ncbi:MAG: GvpL/GvpF family gas vesicle protein [Nitrospirae bacterium]|nr:GvpL/GvpF family gas vesicle protein [Nitrospirota bacterium]
MSLYLYGVIPHREAMDFGPIGFEAIGGERGRVKTIPHGELAAVVGPAPLREFSQVPKEALVRFLLAHQATIEEVMKRFFILPFKFGTVLKDDSELERIFSDGGPFLRDLINRLEGCSEINLVATWVVPEILREISDEDPQIVTYKGKMARGEFVDRAAIGMLLQQALRRRAKVWRGQLTSALGTIAEGIVEHDVLDDAMVFNASFLVRRNRMEDFDRALGGMDAIFRRLHFKCIGPLPPYSFGTVTIKRFDPAKIQEAAGILHLNGTAELSGVKRTYKELSRQCHPDTHPDLSPVFFERLNRAYQSVGDYCKDGPRSLEKEAVEHHVRLQVLDAQRGGVAP